jgi:hypothetical protein
MKITARFFRKTTAICPGLAALFLVACQSIDKRHHVLVSVAEQKMVLLDQGRLVQTYPVSTSKFGMGDERNSYRTPAGRMVVAGKIGCGAPAGAVFKSRRWNGEVLPPDAPGRDPIVSRILWLRGRDAANRNAFSRKIYIHGTTEERNIGQPVSYGCIRMRSRDVIDLYNRVQVGTPVTVTPGRLPLAVRTAGLMQKFQRGIRIASRDKPASPPGTGPATGLP